MARRARGHSNIWSLRRKSSSFSANNELRKAWYDEEECFQNYKVNEHWKSVCLEVGTEEDKGNVGTECAKCKKLNKIKARSNR